MQADSTSAVVPKRARGRARRKPSVKIDDAIRLMTEYYGPFDEEPRLDPAHEVVLTILSQHTSDTNSNRAFRLLMDRFGTLEAVAGGNVAEIEVAISPGGLAKVKGPRIKQVLNLILELNGSLDLSFLREMPLEDAKAWLLRLPGIGPKSAGIILSFSLGMPAMAIDTHIHRVCQRLGLIGPKVNAEKAHGILEAAVAPEQVFPFHVSFIAHGRQVCRAQRPKCMECVVAANCPSRKRFSVDGQEAVAVNTNEPRGRSHIKAPLPHSLPSPSPSEEIKP